MRILREKTAALVIDYQEKLMPVMEEREELEARTSVLLRGLGALDIPMFITQQYTKGLGMSRSFVFETSGSEKYYDKKTFSCLDDETICAALAGTGCTNVVICGIEAHICVLQTCIDLKEAGYQPVLVTDCISSRKERDKTAAIWRAQQEGILLTTAEAILFELTRVSGTPVFKTISGLVKGQ